MFLFQAIHNLMSSLAFSLSNVKELLSMFLFQAIHNASCCTYNILIMSKSYYQCSFFKMQRYDYFLDYQKKKSGARRGAPLGRRKDVRCIAPMGLKTKENRPCTVGLHPRLRPIAPQRGFIEAEKNNFLKDSKRPQIAASGFRLQKYGLFLDFLLFFSVFLPVGCGGALKQVLTHLFLGGQLEAVFADEHILREALCGILHGGFAVIGAEQQPNGRIDFVFLLRTSE